MRLRKNDPTGNSWYMADGVSPACAGADLLCHMLDRLPPWYT